MNTNHLEKFAQETRRKLLDQVSAKLEFVLTTDSPELREKAEQLKHLRQELDRTNKEQLIEKVAYTWFNRLMALRFMDANDFQPLGIRAITPKEGYTIPELLDEAKRGNIPDGLHVNQKKIFDILDGKILSTNPQNEAFKELLIAYCNQLNSIFPFLFERINDYTELLLPDDLTSEFSIVKDVRDAMVVDDCKNVEIIGWLYQYYISEENDRLIKGKKTYNKHEIAPASQLFTPKWIVQYMVDNTLGQLLVELFPNTRITNELDYYIHPSNSEQLHQRAEKKIEDIKFFDPCVGSAHILAYAYDVFSLIYKEQGYNESEIPELIIRNNLYGTDIDERATQLSSFVLMMKGRQNYRRFLNKDIEPNIGCYYDYEFDVKFKNAATLGSLIKVESKDIDSVFVEEGSIFSDKQKELKRLYTFLGQKYDIVVTNPPYISSSRMEATLKQHVETNYPETKSDLFATFILRCIELSLEDGLTGYMSPFVWMFISSYLKLRETIISKHFINNLIQLEYSGFDGATVPICTFTLRNSNLSDAYGNYIRLTDFKGSKVQGPKALEAIGNQKCGWFYSIKQKEFNRIPDKPIGYWLSKSMIDAFLSNQRMDELTNPRSGLSTSDSPRFLRLWYETEKMKQGLNIFSLDEAENSGKKWFPMMKGGPYRKWYGNHSYLVNFMNDGEEVKSWLVNNPNDPTTTSWSRYVRSPKFYFKKGLTWSGISSSKSSMRIMDNSIFGSGGKGLFGEKIEFVLGFLNSNVCLEYLKVFSPTLNFEVGHINKLPLILEDTKYVTTLVENCIELTRIDWNKQETSWDFEHNELIRINGQDLEESYELYKQSWRKKFFQLHQYEEKINTKFFNLYGLSEEFKPFIPLEDITILQDELDRKKLQKLNSTLIRHPETKEVLNYSNIELPFIENEVLKQFISYSVGCMFGRYSLDNKGLVLSNEGETIAEYLKEVGKSVDECSFLPDEDNIIPILNDEWFEDDIVGRFYRFLQVTLGDKDLNKNLAFIEEIIGKDIRKYFIRDFYKDHIKRYKKRPIYWMFSSPNGSFNVLVYMHRFSRDTVSNILNKYLKEFIGKLNTRKEHLQHVQITGSASDKTKAIKEIDNIDKTLVELYEYERNVLYPLATERIEIDLDDGVLVNYNKFGRAVKEVSGLNDKKTKEIVRNFDWVDTSQIT